MIFVGEVHTTLLRHSSAVDMSTATSLLALKAGTPVRYRERPVRLAVSPQILTGVDCLLASPQEVRGIGTASSQAVLVGGQVLQCSSSVHIVQSGAGRRLPWSHYLSHPGMVEAINRADPRRLIDGFLSAPEAPSTMDLGALNGYLHARVQTGDGLDRSVAFRAPPIKLRWAAVPSCRSPSLAFSVGRDGLRSFVLHLPDVRREAAATLSEEIALHDWLLTSVQKLIDSSRIGAATQPDVVHRLAPAVNFLLHLWMPGGRLDDETRPVWEGLEERSGFTRQWRVCIDRIRDQLFLAAASRQWEPPPSDP